MKQKLITSILMLTFTLISPFPSSYQTSPTPGVELVSWCLRPVATEERTKNNDEIDALIEIVKRMKQYDPDADRARKTLEKFQDPRAQFYARLYSDHSFCVDWLVENSSGFVDVLVEALKCDYWYVRMNAAEALRRIQDPKTAMPLIEALRDVNSHVCVQAALALGGLKNPLAVDPLIEVLKSEDKDDYRRNAAAYALGQIQDPKAQLYHSLYKMDIDGLSKIGLFKTTIEKGGLIKCRIENIVPGVVSIDILREALRIPCLRKGAAVALKWSGDPEAVKVLVEALKDEDSSVRGLAASALGVVKSPQTIDPLIKCLKDESEYVRSEAASALCQINDPRAQLYSSLYAAAHRHSADIDQIIIESGRASLDTMIEALSSGVEVRRGAAYGLGILKTSGAVMPLVGALKDEDKHVRCDAAWALGRIQDPRAVESLIEFSREDRYGRSTAVSALGEIQDPRAVGPLVDFLKDENDDVRYSAAKALGQIDNPRAQLYSSLYVAHKHPAGINQIIIESGRASLDTMIEALSSGVEVRHGAAYGLGILKTSGAVMPLVGALKDEDEDVRRDAAWALGQIQDPRAQFYSKLYEGDAHWIVEESAASGIVSAGTLLVAALKSGPEVHSHAVDILKVINDPRALESLADAFQDKDEDVRNAAATALGNSFPSLNGASIPMLSALFTLRPTWKKNLPSQAELDKLLAGVSYLPPLGGKLVRYGTKSIELLSPTLTAEEQADNLLAMEEKGELEKGYIHQLTVQGRLPDESKYVALALIINSLYKYDWEHPFYEAPWGGVQPLIHDGGIVEMWINPAWKVIPGRTDFLERRVGVYVPTLSALDKEWKSLDEDERALKEAEFLMTQPDAERRLKLEQIERARLRLEARSYQRLALALHAHVGTAPDAIPEELRKKLGAHWRNFKEGVRLYLNEYDLGGVDDAIWFLDMLSSLGERRYEADYEPIKRQLMRIQNMRQEAPEKFAELRTNIAMLLASTTRAIDQDLGLLPITESEAAAVPSLPQPAPTQLEELALTQI